MPRSYIDRFRSATRKLARFCLDTAPESIKLLPWQAPASTARELNNTNLGFMLRLGVAAIDMAQNGHPHPLDAESANYLMTAAQNIRQAITGRNFSAAEITFLQQAATPMRTIAQHLSAEISAANLTIEIARNERANDGKLLAKATLNMITAMQQDLVQVKRQLNTAKNSADPEQLFAVFARAATLPASTATRLQQTSKKLHAKLSDPSRLTAQETAQPGDRMPGDRIIQECRARIARNLALNTGIATIVKKLEALFPPPKAARPVKPGTSTPASPPATPQA